MMLATQTFQYIVQNEAEETIGGYTSSAEPPAKGEMIKLPAHPTREAEVVSVSMLLSKRSNRILLKVKPVDGNRQ